MALAAALMAGLGCGLAGMLAASQLKKQEALLAAWVRFIKRLQTTFETRRLPIRQVLETGLNEHPLIDARLKKAMQLMDEAPQLSVSEAFESADELETRLFSGLCEGSLKQRQAALELSLSAFTAAHEKALSSYEKNGRLYQNLGWLGGLALVLLLL
jgi:Stage III sporulation protein AB (spore_III_AB).